MHIRRKRLIELAFLLVLVVYILVGVTLAPAHGDEYMQIAMARDFFFMVRGEWSRLSPSPPFIPDTESYQRVINGTLNKTLIGLAWALGGRSDSALPGIYAWAMPHDWNEQQGNIPDEAGLFLARWPSAILAALGVIPIFLLAKQLRPAWSAYPAALLYTLHPALLVNGRRAMMEGSLVFLTLFTMYWLVHIIKSRQTGARRSVLRHAVLGILVGLTVAAKHTGITVAAAALAAVFLAGLAQERPTRLLLNVGFVALLAGAVWLACNPGYWRDPIGTFQAVVAARAELLERQSAGNPDAYNSFGQRAGALLTQPFLTATQFYEAPTWAGLIDDQIATYYASGLAGLEWGPLVGILLTALAGAGLLALLFDAVERDPVAWALLLWLGTAALSMLAVPLDWQRYYLPWLLPVIILAALGLGRATSLWVRRMPEIQRGL